MCFDTHPQGPKVTRGITSGGPQHAGFPSLQFILFVCFLGILGKCLCLRDAFMGQVSFETGERISVVHLC